MLLYLSGFFFLVVFLYPYVLYPVMLKFLPKRPYRVEPGVNTDNIKVALVFCAYNEEESLPGKIQNIRDIVALVPELEVFAYSDCSSDGTNQMLLEASDILRAVIGETRTGKVIGMKQLVSMTNADVLICTDANVICDPAGIKRLIEYFTLPEVGSVASTLIYTDTDNSEETPTAKVGGLYWRLEESIKRLESETGSMMGADGSLFAVRRDCYPDLPGHLVDDMAASLEPVFQGLRCISAKDVVAYEHSVGNSQEEFKRKKRIACGSYGTYVYMKSSIDGLPLIERFKFYSHKTMRWWGALALFIATCCFLLGGLITGHFLLTSLLLTSAALLIIIAGKVGLPGFSSIYEILKAIIATMMGVFEAMSGKKYEVWVPAKSR